jgi:hypothetical protein
MEKNPQIPPSVSIERISDPNVRTEADAVIEQTLLGVEPVELLPGHFYAVRTNNGHEVIDLTLPHRLKNAGLQRLSPESSFTFHDLPGFTSYVNGVFNGPEGRNNDTQGSDNDVYWPQRNRALCMADEGNRTIRLLFDAQPNEWGTVYADFKLSLSTEAIRWLEVSGKYMVQQDFAEFCELNLDAFQSPDAATILEIAQTFQAKSTVEFSSAVRLANGSIKLKRDESIEATAGERANISIPEDLTVALPLFKYGRIYSVKARLRYRLQDGAVKLSILLVDPEMALEHAFKEVMDEVSQLLGMPVFYGKV